jgi:membrane associated rhomboid family serine protease
MNPASVGFQCPSCVKEGARSTRTGNLPYGGKRVANPQASSIGLIIANAAVWVAILATGGNSSKLLDKLALMPTGRCSAADGAGYYPNAPQAICDGIGRHWVGGVADGSYWQLLSSMFTHVAVLHIGFNMVALWFLGPQLETVLGRARFLALYFISGLAGSAAVMLFAAPQSQTLGASGAIFGLMGALVVVGLKVGANMSQVWMWLGLNLIFTFTAGGISWQGHIGGLLAGAAVAAVLVYAPRVRRTQLQVAGMSALSVVVAVVIVLRAMSLG